MGENTGISWADYTFNIAWGCSKVSPGCKNCYAETLSKRFGRDCFGNSPRVTMGKPYWRNPIRWNRDALERDERPRVFCSSMCDVFEDHPVIDQERERLWRLIRETPRLDWLLLTKRADRIQECLPAEWGTCWDTTYANVWLGVSIESMDYEDRADLLVGIPAAVRFVSYEPVLGPLDGLDLEGIDWLIYGGESGPGRRDADEGLSWARTLRERCRVAGTAFWFKQVSALKPGTGEDALGGHPTKELPWWQRRGEHAAL